VPEKLYKLTINGKTTLEELLYKVKCTRRMYKCKERWSRSELNKWTGLDQASIAKVVEAVEDMSRPDPLNSPVEEGTLLTLFQEIYRKLGQSKSEKELQSCEFWKEWLEDRGSNLSINSINKRPEKLVKLLTTLDYVAQSGQFNTRIGKDCTPLACFMPTPCPSTQKWAIHCLAQQIPNQNNAIRIPLIDVSRHPIRLGNIDLLWDEIAKKLKVERQYVFRSLSQSLLNRPLIIALHNFGQDPDITPQNVIEEFWMPLLNEIPCRTPNSRIVLLMADVEGQFIDTSECHCTMKLPILNSITQLNVEDWLMSEKVKEWWVHEFDNHKNWRSNLDVKFPTWRWDNPSKILDRLCHAFELENGAQSLHKKWEW
jgi:hypothetical protein